MPKLNLNIGRVPSDPEERVKFTLDLYTRITGRIPTRKDVDEVRVKCGLKPVEHSA